MQNFIQVCHKRNKKESLGASEQIFGNGWFAKTFLLLVFSELLILALTASFVKQRMSDFYVNTFLKAVLCL